MATIDRGRVHRTAMAQQDTRIGQQRTPERQGEGRGTRATSFTASERSGSPAASGPHVAPSRFGRRDVRPGPPGRSFQLAPAAGGCGIADMVGVVVIVEVTLSLPGEQPKNAEVYVGHDDAPVGSIGIETAAASGSS
jgi:hypothetical protein